MMRAIGFLSGIALTVAAFLLVLECVPDRVAARITEALAVPVIGMGAGPGCDGQIKPEVVAPGVAVRSAVRTRSARLVSSSSPIQTSNRSPRMNTRSPGCG